MITERNRPAFVLLTYAEYERLRHTPENIAEWLEMSDDIDFEIEPVDLDLRQAEP